MTNEPRLVNPAGFHLPDTLQELFRDAKTLSEVDAIWVANIDGFEVLWSACAATARLKAAGAPVVPGGESAVGWRGKNPFADMQNDAELFEAFLSATEEIHGDGEASHSQRNAVYGRYMTQYRERRAELAAAGIVPAVAPFTIDRRHG